jgi:hypothetical protein
MRVFSYAGPLVASTFLLFANAPGVSAAMTPHLSLVQGKVALWRPGDEHWSAATRHSALNAGDILTVGRGANLEMQFAPRAFLRAGERTEISLLGGDARYLKFALTEGQVAFDVRSLPAGLRLEVDTPHAAFLIDRPGYYRLHVEPQSTRLVTRRNGRVWVFGTAGGPALQAAEATMVEARSTAALAVAMAPEPDAWDRWNIDRFFSVRHDDYLPTAADPDDFERTDSLRAPAERDARSGRSGRSTAKERRHGRGAPAPGQWIWLPRQGWIWFDGFLADASVGHHKRWVYANGDWGWADSPLLDAGDWAPATASVMLPIRLAWSAPLLFSATEIDEAGGLLRAHLHRLDTHQTKYRPAPLPALIRRLARAEVAKQRGNRKAAKARRRRGGRPAPSRAACASVP